METWKRDVCVTESREWEKEEEKEEQWDVKKNCVFILEREWVIDGFLMNFKDLGIFKFQMTVIFTRKKIQILNDRYF